MFEEINTELQELEKSKAISNVATSISPFISTDK